MGLTPVFRILANGTAITELIEPRLQSIKAIDKAGTESDTLTLTLNDHDHCLLLPTTGAVLDVFLGYQETHVEKIGAYIIDEVEFTGPPDVITLGGKAADLIKSLKAPKTRSWQYDNHSPYPLAAIVGKIAAEHGLVPKVGQELQNIRFKGLHQTNESDLHFLTRITATFGAIAKPANGHLLVFKKGLAKSLSEQSLPTSRLTPSDITSWSLSLVERGVYKSVKARYHDLGTAQEHEVSEGQAEPAYTIRSLFNNEQEARLAAQAKLDSIRRGSPTLQLTLPGNPALLAEHKVSLNGFKPEMNGNWIIEEATHSFSVEGYCSQINCTKARS